MWGFDDFIRQFLFLKEMVDHFSTSAQLAPSFRESDVAELARSIMADPSAFEELALQGGTARRVYPLGAFSAGGEQHHAVLKRYNEPASGHAVAFEPTLFYVASVRGHVDVPRFSFIVQHGFEFGLVGEDLSQGGKYAVEEYVLAAYNTSVVDHAVRTTHFHELNMVLSTIDYKAFFRFTRSEAYGRIDAKDIGVPILYGTSFVVRSGDEITRLVCGDVDQLYPFFKEYDKSAEPSSSFYTENRHRVRDLLIQL